MFASNFVASLIIVLGISTIAFPVAAQQPATRQQPATPQVPTPAPTAESAWPTAVPKAAAEDKAGGHAMQGMAAYYNNRLNGHKTASGARFDNRKLTAAHNTLPFGSRVKVTNLKNKRSVIVTINDRGPTSPDRIIDLSAAAAKKLGFGRAGLREVTLVVVGKAPMKARQHAAKHH